MEIRDDAVQRSVCSRQDGRIWTPFEGSGITDHGLHDEVRAWSTKCGDEAAAGPPFREATESTCLYDVHSTVFEGRQALCQHRQGH